MRYLFTVVCVAMIGSACAGVEVRRDGPGTRYHVNGYTANPEAAITAASMAATREQNTDEYWKAVRRGQAYPYQGGGYGNDYWFHYGSQGVAPVPQTPVADPEAASSGGYATKDEVEEVREKADDAYERATDGLKMHKRLRDKGVGGAR